MDEKRDIPISKLYLDELRRDGGGVGWSGGPCARPLSGPNDDRDTDPIVPDNERLRFLTKSTLSCLIGIVADILAGGI